MKQRSIIFFIVFLILPTGCKDNSANPDINVTGTWNLISAYFIIPHGYTWGRLMRPPDVTGTIVFTEDRYNSTFNKSSVPEIQEGFYSISGNTITFFPENKLKYTGKAYADLMTIDFNIVDNEGIITESRELKYKKEENNFEQ